MPRNQWWTERIERAEAAFDVQDAETLVRVIREMWNRSGPTRMDPSFGVARARKALETAITMVRAGEFGRARYVFDAAISTIAPRE